MAPWIRRQRGSMEETMWLSGSTPECNAAVPGFESAPPQSTAKSVSPWVGCHPGRHAKCVGLRGAAGGVTQNP
jgi:hypothetical protein